MAELPTLPAGYEFHHIGYATNGMDRELGIFATLGYAQEGDSFADPVQGIRGCFITGPGPRIELLENLPGSTTLTPWLDAGIRMYHFAYLVDDMNAALEWARGRRGKVTVAPVPAVAFDQRCISFVMLPNRLLLEFIARHR